MNIYLWIRPDGERPKAIEKGRVPPFGRVVKVESVRTSNEARRVYYDARHGWTLGPDGLEALLGESPAEYGKIKQAMTRIKWVNTEDIDG